MCMYVCVCLKHIEGLMSFDLTVIWCTGCCYVVGPVFFFYQASWYGRLLCGLWLGKLTPPWAVLTGSCSLVPDHGGGDHSKWAGPEASCRCGQRVTLRCYRYHGFQTSTAYQIRVRITLLGVARQPSHRTVRDAEQFVICDHQISAQSALWES